MTQQPTRLGRMRGAIVKARSRGPAWLANRAAREFFIPTTTIGRAFRNTGAFVERMMRPSSSVDQGNRFTLYLFLDLEVCPVTFDVASYLAAAELRRRELGLHDLHVIVVPGTSDGVREEPPDYEKAVDPDARRWRLHNLVIPLFRLLPSCTGYTVCGSRADAESLLMGRQDRAYPLNYSVRFPEAPGIAEVAERHRAGQAVFPMLASPPSALKYVRQFLDERSNGRRVVVLSLRQYDYMPARNSNTADWVAFAAGLDPARWMPVFVLDTEVALGLRPAEIEPFVICDAASWNIEIRAALYELADLTLGVAQGAMELCWLNHRCRYAMFLRPGSSPHTSNAALSKLGIEPDQSPAYAGPDQRWIWSSDDLPVIRRVFDEMTRADAAAASARPG